MFSIRRRSRRLTDSAAAVPSGMTIARPAGSMPYDVVADVYQQQVLASLSGKLGNAVAGKSADALLPDANGRIDNIALSPTPAEIQHGFGDRTSGLDLPPPSVGPLSLRIAAANGDASAEFEVAARLAEGKGTRAELRRSAALVLSAQPPRASRNRSIASAPSTSAALACPRMLSGRRSGTRAPPSRAT